MIVQSVGRDAPNLPGDVRTVQRLLNRCARCRPSPPLVEDGVAGPITIAAIEAAQQAFSIAKVDGRIDPGGPTLAALAWTNPTSSKAPLTIAQMCAIMPSLSKDKADAYFPHLVAAMEEFDINDNALRQAAFLAQIAHESGEFRFMREIWGPTPTQKRYEGRADLGNTQPGDGERFKGRGPIQITGRANYKKYGDLLGLPLTEKPEMAETPDVAFRIAGAFWKNTTRKGKNLNQLADTKDFVEITKAINGGTNGLQERQEYYASALRVLGA